MNASFCCNHIQQHPQFFKIQHASSSARGRNPIQWPSAAIQTAESELANEEAASQSESVARRLILLRHARSSGQKLSLRDHDRPLSKDGKVDAIKIAHKLQELSWIPELILSSDAKRTRETLQIMQEQVSGFLEAEVHFISSFYSIAAMDGQTAEHLQQVISNYSRNEIITVMCMGHNRGWEEAASMFSGSSIKLKTCNAALLEASGKSWDEKQKKKRHPPIYVCLFPFRFSEDPIRWSGSHVLYNSVEQNMLILLEDAFATVQAFALAGLGGWKLHGIVKPNSRS